jgi:hypothetical protein
VGSDSLWSGYKDGKDGTFFGSRPIACVFISKCTRVEPPAESIACPGRRSNTLGRSGLTALSSRDWLLAHDLWPRNHRSKISAQLLGPRCPSLGSKALRSHLSDEATFRPHGFHVNRRLSSERIGKHRAFMRTYLLAPTFSVTHRRSLLILRSSWDSATFNSRPAKLRRKVEISPNTR